MDILQIPVHTTFLILVPPGRRHVHRTLHQPGHSHLREDPEGTSQPTRRLFPRSGIAAIHGFSDPLIHHFSPSHPLTSVTLSLSHSRLELVISSRTTNLLAVLEILLSFPPPPSLTPSWHGHVLYRDEWPLLLTPSPLNNASIQSRPARHERVICSHREPVVFTPNHLVRRLPLYHTHLHTDILTYRHTLHAHLSSLAVASGRDSAHLEVMHPRKTKGSPSPSHGSKESCSARAGRPHIHTALVGEASIISPLVAIACLAAASHSII